MKYFIHVRENLRVTARTETPTCPNLPQTGQLKLPRVTQIRQSNTLAQALRTAWRPPAQSLHLLGRSAACYQYQAQDHVSLCSIVRSC